MYVPKVTWGHYQEFDKFRPCCRSVNLIQNGFYRHPPHLLMLSHMWISFARDHSDDMHEVFFTNFNKIFPDPTYVIRSPHGFAICRASLDLKPKYARIMAHMMLFKLWLTFCGQYCENKKFAKRRKLCVFQSKIQCRFQFWSKKYKILNLKIVPIDLYRARSVKNEAKMRKNLCKKISPSIWGHIEPNNSNLV